MLTARDSILNPRRENSPDTRARTPGVFSTSALMVCCIVRRSAFGGRAWERGHLGQELPFRRPNAEHRLSIFTRFPRAEDQVVVGLAGGDHRVDVFGGGDADVDDDRDVP